jgi:hypothetical protein
MKLGFNDYVLPLFVGVEVNLAGVSVESHLVVHAIGDRTYNESPAVSWERIVRRIQERFPGAEEHEIVKLIGRKPK